MFCANCGKDIPVNAKFCPYCAHAAVVPAEAAAPEGSVAHSTAPARTPLPVAAPPMGSVLPAAAPTAAPPKAKAKTPFVILAAVVGALVLAAAALVAFAVLPGILPATQSDAAQGDTDKLSEVFLRDGNTTYIFVTGEDRRSVKILKVADGKDAKPEELYSESFNNDQLLYFIPLAVYDNRLFFGFDYSGSGGKRGIIELDLGSPGAKPQEVDLTWKGNFELPEYLGEEEKDDVLSYTNRLGKEGSKLYQRLAGTWSEGPILVIDLNDKSITPVENTLRRDSELWWPFCVQNGSLYYLKTNVNSEGIDGLYKTSLGGNIIQEEQLFGDDVLEGSIGWQESSYPVLVAGNLLYFNKAHWLDGYYEFTICAIDLGSLKQQIIVDRKFAWVEPSYSISDGYLYYFDENNLHRCKADGSGDDELLMQNAVEPPFTAMSNLLVCGDWLYFSKYKQESACYRVALGGNEFTTESLN